MQKLKYDSNELIVIEKGGVTLTVTQKEYSDRYKGFGYKTVEAQKEEQVVDETLAQVPEGSKTPDAPVVVPDEVPVGPALKQWVEAGYKAEAYPPKGFQGVEDDDLKAYRETGKLPEITLDDSAVNLSADEAPEESAAG